MQSVVMSTHSASCYFSVVDNDTRRTLGAATKATQLTVSPLQYQPRFFLLFSVFASTPPSVFFYLFLSPTKLWLWLSLFHFAKSLGLFVLYCRPPRNAPLAST